MFNLTRYFSVLSLILVACAGLVLGSYFYHFSSRHMIEQAEHDNVSMTQFIRNAMYIQFYNALSDSYHENKDLPEIMRENAARLYLNVDRLVRGSDVLKVKLYNRDGITVFSSDLEQLGESWYDKDGFHAAMDGDVYSVLRQRNMFLTHYGEQRDVNFIASYIPMRNDEGVVEGVFETYREVSPLVARVEQTLWQVAGVAAISLLLLYLMQLWVVRRAQCIMHRQAAELESMNKELDRRVQERTASLENEITERINAERRLDHLAYHDPLTGLPNRLLFKEHLTTSLVRMQKNNHSIAVLFIDLDRFKDVNDTLGHSMGDALLVVVTRRIRACVRERDTLARHGGDEFICIIEDVTDKAEVCVVAEKLLAQFNEPFTVSGNELFLSASIGISLAPDDGEDVDILVRNADAAMYQAKESGRNRYHFYSSEMTRLAQERMRMETLLRHAIAHDELLVYFQPKLDVKSGNMAGAEALLRWHSPQLGVIPPSQFIPLAEDNGHIVEIGAWVMRAGLHQLLEWDRAGFSLPHLSINLSVKQLERADFVTQVQHLLEETGIQPSRIEFEITESVIMSVDDSIAILKRLCELGVSLSVDDFGTGYSSLTYLKELPVQVIKIDRSFINGIGMSISDEAIIRTVIELSHSLGFSTVAEGIETEQQAEFLYQAGCDQMQGYLFGRPVPADEFIARWQTTPSTQ
jgi:diguanylate cyclase (GGDEF)-like protein